VFNDWECVAPTLSGIQAAEGLTRVRRVVMVDDGPLRQVAASWVVEDLRVKLTRLWTNVGHQRSNSIGLVSIASEDSKSLVIVLDSDEVGVPLVWLTLNP